MQLDSFVISMSYLVQKSHSLVIVNYGSDSLNIKDENMKTIKKIY